MKLSELFVPPHRKSFVHLSHLLLCLLLFSISRTLFSFHWHPNTAFTRDPPPPIIPSSFLSSHFRFNLEIGVDKPCQPSVLWSHWRRGASVFNFVSLFFSRPWYILARYLRNLTKLERNHLWTYSAGVSEKFLLLFRFTTNRLYLYCR